jgi:nucleotide-binding universal stress UspA family protein
MTNTHPPLSVVAGIDGSTTAIQSAQWAVDEAISREAPLRLVYVTKATHPSAQDYENDVRQGKAALHAAQAAIEATGKPVKLETAIVTGPPGAALVEESRDAGMVCLGSVGIGRYARSILGSTATELAEKARCPVAIIRPQPEVDSRDDIHWIAVAVNDETDNPAVVEQAMAQAKLRNAPVLAIGERRARHGTAEALDAEVDTWRRRYPDVHIYPIADQTDVASFLRHCDEQVQLAVIGESEAHKLADLVGPIGQSVLHHAKVSVLVVRH